MSGNGSAGNVRGRVVVGGGAGASVIGMIGAGCVEAAAHRLLPRRGCHAIDVLNPRPTYACSCVVPATSVTGKRICWACTAKRPIYREAAARPCREAAARVSIPSLKTLVFPMFQASKSQKKILRRASRGRSAFPLRGNKWLVPTFSPCYSGWHLGRPGGRGSDFLGTRRRLILSS